MTSFPNWRCFLDEVRTFFEQTPPTKEAPPTLKLWRAGTPATARQARHTTEKYSLLFSFCLPVGMARAGFFLLKGKQNFSLVFCSERAGRRGFALARARRNSPHTPPFRPLAETILSKRTISSSSLAANSFLYNILACIKLCRSDRGDKILVSIWRQSSVNRTRHVVHRCAIFSILELSHSIQVLLIHLIFLPKPCVS